MVRFPTLVTLPIIYRAIFRVIHDAALLETIAMFILLVGHRAVVIMGQASCRHERLIGEELSELEYVLNFNGKDFG